MMTLVFHNINSSTKHIPCLSILTVYLSIPTSFTFNEKWNWQYSREPFLCLVFMYWILKPVSDCNCVSKAVHYRHYFHSFSTRLYFISDFRDGAKWWTGTRTFKNFQSNEKIYTIISYILCFLLQIEKWRRKKSRLKVPGGVNLSYMTPLSKVIKISYFSFNKSQPCYSNSNSGTIQS